MPWHEKFERLKQIIGSYESVLVAFSGGCDSALVAKVSRDVLGREKAKAVTAKSESLPRHEIEAIESFVTSNGIEHHWIETREIENPQYASNPINRCFFCKTELYQDLIPLAKEWEINTLVNGANLDDLEDWRPGLKAAKEYEIKSPLVEAGLCKSEIREISRFLNLSTWDKPAAACLSSRIPYGQPVTREKLSRIDRGEQILRDYGFRILRLRHFENKARIEVGLEELARFSENILREEIFSKIRSLGFQTVEIDPEGYRQGKLNPAT